MSDEQVDLLEALLIQLRTLRRQAPMLSRQEIVEALQAAIDAATIYSRPEHDMTIIREGVVGPVDTANEESPDAV